MKLGDEQETTGQGTTEEGLDTGERRLISLLIRRIFRPESCSRCNHPLPDISLFVLPGLYSG